MNNILLALVLLLTPLGRLARGQQPFPKTSELAKVKSEIARRRTGDKVMIKLRNGSELKGRITQTSQNMFTFKEDTRGQRDINYVEVASVKGQGLSKGAKFGILTAIVTGAVVIGALISLKHMDPFENGVLH